jgi:hypothetical protein
MSYTSLYSIFKTKAVCFKELRNSYGTGMAVWDYISMKYTGDYFSLYGDVENFWLLWKDERLSENERAVLLSTYDYFFVETEHLNRFSEACKDVHRQILEKTRWSWSHFETIGEEAAAMHKKHDYRCLGLGIGCTSVCDPWESWKPEQNKPSGVYDLIEKLLEVLY